MKYDISVQVWQIKDRLMLSVGGFVGGMEKQRDTRKIIEARCLSGALSGLWPNDARYHYLSHQYSALQAAYFTDLTKVRYVL